MAIVAVGSDLAKTVSALHGVGATGTPALAAIAAQREMSRQGGHKRATFGAWMLPTLHSLEAMASSVRL